ncbi:MAG: PAS domain S-box protein, partial [Syntrophales bacterium]
MFNFKADSHISAGTMVEGKKFDQPSIRDITARKRAEDALQASETRYRRLFETAQDGILILNAETGEIDDVNPYMIDMLHYSYEEFVGKKLWEVSPFKDKVFNRAVFEELQYKGYIRYKDLPLQTKEGKPIAVEFVSNVYKANGNKVIQCNIRNITERKNSEEELRNSQGRLHTLVQTIPDLIWLKDKDGVYLSCNTMFERFFGAKERDIVGKTDYDFVDRELADFFREHDRKAMAAGKPTINEEWITFADDGHRAFLETIKTPMHDAQGTLVGVLGIGRDITERKRSEEALKESENKYRLLADNVNDVIFVLDMNLNYTYVSPSIKILRGYEPAEVLKQPSIETLTPSSWDLAMRTISEVMELEKSGHRDIKISRTLQLEMLRKDGTTVWTEVKFSFLRDENQRMVGILGLTRDITERKRVEEELKLSEERYRSIFENAQEGISRSTPDGKIIMANQAMAKMFGYESPEEMMAGVNDMAHQHYVYPEDRRKLKEMIEEHGFIKGHESQHYRKDGSIIWVSMTLHAVRDGKGQIIYYDGIIEEITNRKQAVERIRKALGATVQAIAVTVETRDPYTAGHQRRVTDLARAITTEMNLPIDMIDGIRMAAAIHDIGKISVPAEILSKPTNLTDLELGIIKTHSQSGYDILKDIDFPWPIARMVLEHHERMNGSGYPNGLTGDNILMESRILAVADVVESMASHRPYRPSLGTEAALEEIEKNRGTLYDNAVADA